MMSVETVVQEKSDNRRRLLWRGVNLVVAIALVAFIFNQVEWSSFLEMLSGLSPVLLFAAFFVYFLQNVFRSQRFIVLLDRNDIPIKTVIPIALYHNFLVRILPFKLGEFSYIVLMRNRLDVPVEEGTSSLLGSRLLEFLMMVSVVAVTLPLAGGMISNQKSLAMTLGIVSVATVVIGFYFSGAILRWLINVMRRMIKSDKVEAMAVKLEGFAQELDRIGEPRLFAKAVFWSCFSYASSFGVIAIMLYAVGLDVDPVTWIALVSIGMFSTGIPFNIGGFGSVELGWAFGLTTFAVYGMSEATSIGLMINGFQLLSAATLGLIGYGVVQLTENRKG
ncbi:MAG: lysylphosphatidylglycerol synthase transmembrane domain-containing protein [Anaerolineae bacterium]|nr:lysylphosphatidylglycerol synthase transmembrane domain-containing protein [Anaerolineae bacterium]